MQEHDFGQIPVNKQTPMWRARTAAATYSQARSKEVGRMARRVSSRKRARKVAMVTNTVTCRLSRCRTILKRQLGPLFEVCSTSKMEPACIAFQS